MSPALILFGLFLLICAAAVIGLALIFTWAIRCLEHIEAVGLDQ